MRLPGPSQFRPVRLPHAPADRGSPRCLLRARVRGDRAGESSRRGALGGLASTAWPFLAGLAVGLLVTRAWRRPAAIVPAGLGAWLGTVAVGMLLRVVAGQGTAVAFIGVALAFLGLFLLGWRAVAAVAFRRGRAPSLAPRS